ncbi:CHAT domain-containing protein [Sphingobium algorifonticola]|uniref:CHAT domain-containing protein n=1 Tax=Sphingobium algorifonticola TaxID=2008318 RepID=UPI001F49B728|nr:CHAT domain-containing protein [Sphingobium algorifonticola]
MRRYSLSHAAALAALILALPTPAGAQGDRPSLADSFRLGTGGGALCQAQSRSGDPAVGTLFDRAWTIACRDSAQPVGRLYALRLPAGISDAALLEKLTQSRGAALACSEEGGATLPDLGTVLSRNCRIADNGVAYRIIRFTRGNTTYVAQGFASYGSALDIGLRTIVTDRAIDAKVEIATLGGDDMAAFARLQAANLDPQTVLAEGYRRNNSGNYAEAAEFFDSLEDRLAAAPDTARLTPVERQARAHEYAVNRALQLSNMGEFAQADGVFAQARTIATRDPVQLRLRRNFEAMHRLNQRDYAAALALLNQPLGDPLDPLRDEAGGISLSPQIAAAINSAGPSIASLTGGSETKLTPVERAAIIDAQTEQLRGTLLRLTGKPAQARATLAKALADAMAIREGRVTSITRLRAQLLAEIALTHEAEGDFATAEAQLIQAVALLAAQYPETVAMNGARARLGAFLVRRGRTEDAIALYRRIIASTAESRNALTGLSNQLQPWFALLAAQIPTRPELTADLFLATQTLVRPGAADTLEVLTRELSAGTSEGSRLFRQSVSLARDIERARITLAQLTQAQATNPAVAGEIAAQQRDIAALADQQTATLAALAAYPQYRAVAKDVLTLADMQATLKPGEAYFKMAQLGDALYAVWIDGEGATGYRLPVTTAALAQKVTDLRETISTTVNGAQATYPLDVTLARSLYGDLFAPVEARLATARHLIVEPDGAMLQLPVNLLIASQTGVDAYTKRVAANPDSEFDFRGIEWLGRSHAISTALSARAFRDARNAPASAAARDYIGFGENAPVSPLRKIALTRAAGGASGPDCTWPAAEWSRPIPATELRQAAQRIGLAGSEVLTGTAFTDDAILARDNLDSFRILHFATHGLVTAPRAQCPARPALLTSFGGAGTSDGLLQFGEIFDLKLDADLVILSACDTAGKASVEATRAAGLTGGGGALDGLVRAFIGAGGRSVIASHWPAPEEYKATERLIGGLFSAPRGTGTAQALQQAEIALMDQAETSHPFYWSGFAIIGDGARPLVTPAAVAAR